MDSTGMAYYLGYAAAADFHAQQGRWPGDNPAEPLDSAQDDLDRDTSAVMDIFASKLKQIGWTDEAPLFLGDCVGEMWVLFAKAWDARSQLRGGRFPCRCRGGASTIPTTAAFLGGVVAQEAIKLVTSQYIPLNNTSVVDLVKGGVDKYML